MHARVGAFYRALILSLAVILAACQGGRMSTTGSPAAKPASPIVLTLTTTTTPQPGEPVEVIATATTRISTPLATLTVTLPQNIPLLEGSTSWQGALDSGISHSLRFTVMVPTTNSGIITAVCDFSPSAAIRYSGAAQLQLGSPLPSPPPERRLEGVDGTPLIEIPAE